jgi:hypothetical protein
MMLQLGGGASEKPESLVNGLALCIGLNAVNPDFYEGWGGPLNACENDANAMAHYLGAKGFHTTVLLTKAATRDAVLTKIGDFAKIAKPGDTVVITNSSHGGQVPDYDNTEADGMDETICMYDGEIIDDELEAAWAKFAAGVRIVFVSDSCHSGTVARAMFSDHNITLSQKGSRAMPIDVQNAVNTLQSVTLQSRKAEVSRQHSEIAASVLQLGACQDSQTAMDGAVNGAFTGALLSVLRTNKGGYGNVVVAVRRMLPPSQTPSYAYAGPRFASFENGAAFTI